MDMGYGNNSTSYYTNLNYSIVMTTTGATATDYTNVKVYVYTGSSIYSAFTSSEASFTLSPTPTPTPDPNGGSGGGGGGGGGAPSADIKTDSYGKVLETYTKTSSGGKATITIPKGTVAKTSEGKPLESISIMSMKPISGTIALYDLRPDGATFDPEITFTVTYDPKDVPEGKVIVIRMYDGKKWIELKTTVDTVKHTATAKISHFSTFALFLEKKPSTTPAPTAAPTAAPTPIPTTAPPVPPSPDGGSKWPLVILIMMTVAIVVLLGYYYQRRDGNNGI